MEYFISADEYAPSKDSTSKNTGDLHREIIVEAGKSEAHIIALEEIRELALKKRMSTMGLTKLSAEALEQIDAKINKYGKILSPEEISSMLNSWENERSDLGLVETNLPKKFSQLSKVV